MILTEPTAIRMRKTKSVKEQSLAPYSGRLEITEAVPDGNQEFERGHRGSASILQTPGLKPTLL